MELYLKFLTALTVGLLGAGLAMTYLLEAVLSEWDPVLSARRWWRQLFHVRHNADSVRAEDILHEAEGRRHGVFSPRQPETPIDRRREVLRDMREAEERLASPEPVESL